MSRTPRLSKKFSKPTLSRLINGDISAPPPSIEELSTRLDHALVAKYPAYSRGTIQKLIKDGSITVNGKITTKANTAVSEEDILGLTPPTVPPPEQKPNLQTIFEDDNILVLNKPAGMLSISKGEYNPEPTIEDYGLLVHRLDRGTSGVIILAKNPKVQTLLRKQFQDRKAHKTYYAITSGHPNPPHAIIDIPLARNLSRPTTFRPDPSGREAITEYEITKSGNQYSLVKLHPTTGRTHQLRVHLAHINTPILGDTAYGGSPAPRLFLHAAELEITIPGGTRQTFVSPLPEEFTNALR